MSIWEAIGGLFVIYMACVGVATHGWFVIAGINRIRTRLELGQVREEAAFLGISTTAAPGRGR